MAGSPTLNPLPAAAKSPRKSRKNADDLLLRPATAAGWELWAGNNGTLREVGRFETPPEAQKSELRAVALPARYVVVFSRWLQTNDASLLGDMVNILLERQGLAPRDEGGKSFSFVSVLREENRTLVAIRLLSPLIPEALCQPQVERFEVAADLQPLLPNGLTLWREAGRVVAAFSRDGMLVHLQSFHDALVTSGLAIELLCTRLQLETEEIILPDARLSILDEFSEEEQSLLTSILGGQAAAKDSGPPILPKSVSALTPPLVEVLRRKNFTRQRIERILLGAAGVYALLLLGLILNVVWITYRNQSLRKAIAADQPTVDAIRSTETRWKAIEGAVNPTIYPVEVLLQSANLLPDDGIRFTLFEDNENKVRITGEANSAAAAFKLVESIKAKDDLNYFDWEMPKPNILPNDKAEFTIQGNPPDAPAH